jgi:2-polyprenyl-6-methoxyphenol hydroxylase-like FAD-dependent oxidoreductase
LAPSILPILEDLGVRERVEGAGFLRPDAVLVNWGEPGRTRRKIYPERALNVDRKRFDQLLLTAAVEAGAKVIRPALAVRPEALGDDTWRVPYHAAAHEGEVRCRFFVDSAGKGGFGRGRRPRAGPATVAVHGIWQGIGKAGIEPRVEAGEHHWAWGAALPGGRAVAAVFLDPAALRDGGADAIESSYRHLLQRTPLLRHFLDGELVGAVSVCDASQRPATPETTAGWMRVGEAAACVDPLSSQGVQHAIVDALQAAAVVATLLAAPRQAKLAREFHAARRAEAAERDQITGTAHYRAQAERFPTAFWSCRAATEESMARPPSSIRDKLPDPACRLRLSDQILWQEIGLLEGGMIVPGPALTHPSLPRPVAFLAGQPAASVLAAIPREATARDISLCLHSSFGPRVSTQVMDWLWRNRVLVALV